MDIIVEYNPDYKINHDKLLFPIYSNQKYNSYLKEIADFCGINKELTSLEVEGPLHQRLHLLMAFQ
jgi:hypothetical protein